MQHAHAGNLAEDVGARHADRASDPAGRERWRAAIENQQEHFDMFGLQLGFGHETGALVVDGSKKPTVANPVRDFVPTTQPGSRVPHAWVERAGRRLSVLDLLPYDAFSLLTGPAGVVWAGAAAGVPGVPIHLLSGALLIRPDQHVAWRAPSAPADAGSALASAVRTLLAASR